MPSPLVGRRSPPSVVLSGVLMVALAAVLQPPAAAAQELAPAPDWGVVARQIVAQGQLGRGERVLLLAVPGAADGVIEPLRAAVRAAGGEDLGALAARGPAPAAWETPFTRGAGAATVQELESALAPVNLAIILPGAAPTDAAYAALQRLVTGSAAGGRRVIHFHWAGAYSLDGALLPTTPAYARHYQDVLVRTNYRELGERQRAFERAMRGAPVRVTTPAGTDLTFRIGDRTVTRQDGDASAARAREGRTLIDREVELPAGAIRVAPVESSVEGTVAFPDAEWGGVPVRALRMQFAGGRLTGFAAAAGAEGVTRELAGGGDAARSFREFALGFNPLLAIPATGDRWIPYYGYGAGVTRLSLGDNTELGGEVRGGYVRWNFFIDATVTVGGEVWVRDGVLVK